MSSWSISRSRVWSFRETGTEDLLEKVSLLFPGAYPIRPQTIVHVEATSPHKWWSERSFWFGGKRGVEDVSRDASQSSLEIKGLSPTASQRGPRDT